MQKNTHFFYALYLLFLLVSCKQYAAIKIVELNRNNWQLFKNLRLKSMQESSHAFDTTYAEEIKTTEFNWKRRLNHNMLFAQDGTRIVGMIGAYINPLTKLKHKANIISFYVMPEFRGKGVGKLLLQSLIDKLNNLGTIKTVALKVTASQTNAIGMYKKYGFAFDGVLKNEYFENNRFYDQLVMTKSIN